MSRVLERRWFGKGIFELILTREDWRFRPGDATLLVMPDKVTARPYSLSGPMDADSLAVLIRRLPSGDMSSFLAECPPGTEIGTSPPIPQLNLSQSSNMIWIATGTGISPFLSALRSGFAPPRLLLFGARTLDEAPGWDLIRDRCEVRLFLSGERRQGFPNRRIQPQDVPILPGLRYAMCGHGSLAQELREYLMRNGVPMTHLQIEVFFP